MKKRITLFEVIQAHERQGLASCNFELQFLTSFDNLNKPIPDRFTLDFESPGWNFQTDEDFIDSAIATAFTLFMKNKGYKVVLEKIPDKE